jgi:hypothetical protein
MAAFPRINALPSRPEAMKYKYNKSDSFCFLRASERFAAARVAHFYVAFALVSS